VRNHETLWAELSPKLLVALYSFANLRNVAAERSHCQKRGHNTIHLILFKPKDTVLRHLTLPCYSMHSAAQYVKIGLIQYTGLSRDFADALTQSGVAASVIILRRPRRR
jgi:hypothetical protein